MKLVPTKVVTAEGFKLFSDYAQIANVIGAVNAILNDKVAFLSIYSKIGNKFMHIPSEEMNGDRLFQRCKEYGNVTVGALQVGVDGVTSEYLDDTVMDAIPKAARKTIRVNPSYVGAVILSEFEAATKFVFLLVSFLHEICHLLTYHFNDLSGNGVGDKFATSPKIGCFKRRDLSEQADCGVGLEFELFGGLPALYQKRWDMLCVYQIIDLNLPALGENLRRIPVPRNSVIDLFNGLLVWYKRKTSISGMICRVCQSNPFPFALFDMMNTKTLNPDTSLPCPIDSVAKNLEELEFVRCKCVLSDTPEGFIPNVRIRDEIIKTVPPSHPDTKR